MPGVIRHDVCITLKLQGNNYPQRVKKFLYENPTGSIKRVRNDPKL